MPAEFIVQHPDVANPPTLFLPLAAAAARLRAPAPAGLGGAAARAEAQDRTEDLAFLRAGGSGEFLFYTKSCRYWAHAFTGLVGFRQTTALCELSLDPAFQLQRPYECLAAPRQRCHSACSTCRSA